MSEMVSLSVSLPRELDERLTRFIETRPEWSLDVAFECAIEAFLDSHRPLVGRPPVALEMLEVLDIEIDPGLYHRLSSLSPNCNAVAVRAIEGWLRLKEMASYG